MLRAQAALNPDELASDSAKQEPEKEDDNELLIDEEIESLARSICADDTSTDAREAAFVILMQEIQQHSRALPNMAEDLARLAALAAYGASSFADNTQRCLLRRYRTNRRTGETAWDGVSGIVSSHLENLEEERERNYATS
jgi:hypothetical protein